MKAAQIRLSPEWQAQQDYRQDCFMNPYPEGSNDWQDYEREKKRIIAHLEFKELMGF